MKRRNFVDIIGKSSLIMTVCNSCSIVGSLQSSRKLIETPEKRADYLAKMLKALCTDLGPRPIGSPAYKKSALIVKKEMEKSLPIVELDKFTFERWVLKSDPEFYVGDLRLETFPGHGTSGTPTEGLNGILKKIDDKDGIPYGVIDKSTREIIAYVTPSTNEYANPLPYYSFNKKVKCLPTFNIGKKDFPILEEAWKNETLIRLNAQVEFIPNTPTCNVVGTLPGESKDEIVLLAHLDTVYCCPGANDNTATVIVLLMLAHALAGTRPKKTITFIATTGEEYDKLGAINYVERRKREGSLQNIKFVFNFDSFTWGPDLVIMSADEELKTLVKTLDSKYNKKGTPEMGTSDGFWLDARPFRETGARALSITSGGSETLLVWHRPNDTVENVPFEYAETNFLVFNEFIERLQYL